MKWIFVCVLAVGLLTGCTSGAAPTPTNGASQGGEDETKRIGDKLQAEIEQRDAEQNKEGAEQPKEPVPPSVVYESVFDIPLESLESDTFYSHQTKIAKIETINQENPDHSIIGGIKMAYILTFETPGPERISVYLTENDTHVFRHISDHEKQLISLSDLKVGQEIEVQYCSPHTPITVATEIVILGEA